MPPRKPARSPIVILTDFGYRDHYAGVMKGVIAKIAPDASVIDLTHGIPPQSVTAGALALAQSQEYFPARSVFLAVVDPGVGTSRDAIALETRTGARFVGPDNGLLSLAATAGEIKRAVRLTSTRYRLPNLSPTFHGRDVFAPAAAHIWNGVPLTALGPELKSWHQLELPRPVESDSRLSGEVIYVDTYGNLVTNLDRETVARFAACFPTQKVSVRINRGAAIRIIDSYALAPKGAPLAIFGSFNLLEIALRDGNAAQHFDAKPGAGVILAVSARRK
ncbi:MAG: SAM-dependent chlorinase/fluorinase [Candidatus Binatus sp.]|uniref:SAM hydrolase/SAM-dependent halogenase family protein n=1 Tax=Candidatus Binatus sp. TaxID=2811406 RepID=UPI00271839CC|nr:SAM-dependent chlorinase/fluorinase [Candidatus Binatus sp.]MDO8432738.1 SAM-dependent chlorinase/fluorinase [Candidatus Binatus sp.]